MTILEVVAVFCGAMALAIFTMALVPASVSRVTARPNKHRAETNEQ